MIRDSLPLLERDIIGCTRCPRLRSYCLAVAIEKRRAYREWDYWGKPVPGFGDPNARLWIVGLAPGAHGANRTGRVFTGDRSGDFLFAALHRAGFANQPTSISKNDGLQLSDCFISAAVRCAPPDNKPLPAERQNCSTFLTREWALLKKKRAILALGRFAWDCVLDHAKRMELPVQRCDFGHGRAIRLADSLDLIGSFHVSQQNTFTGRLTPAMFDTILFNCCRKFVEI